MLHFLFLIFCGWLVSFLGQLPLGTMSITAAQISVEENFKNAFKYSIGVTIIEIVYLRLVLTGVDWIMRHHLFFTIIGWLTVLFFLGLGVVSFISAIKQKGNEKPMLLNNKIDRFFLGITMSTLNPAQIPFWFIWSSYLIQLNVLASNFTEFNFFTLGCGIGTISGLVVYMYGGNWLITKLKASNKVMNIIMGIIFIIAGFAQLYRMFVGKLV
jgi:threonine/homoserine/homoserine lactone efflux protein